MRVRTTASALAPASSSAARMISKQRCACPYASAGGSASSGIPGAVPLTYTWPPATTAREYPMIGSYFPPEEMRRRSTRLVSPRVKALMHVDGWSPDNIAVGVVDSYGVRDWHGVESRESGWSSITKPVVALAILVAAEEGVVDLDEDAGPPGSTVRNLLSHASGMPFDGTVPIAGVGERRI